MPLFERDVDTGGGRGVAQRVVQQDGERVHDRLHRAPLDHHGPHLGVLDPLVPLDPAHRRPRDVGQRGRGPAPGQLVPGEYGVPRRGEQHLLGEVVDLHQRRVRLVRDVPPYALADGPAEPRRPRHDVVGEAAYGGPGHADGLVPHLRHVPLGLLPDLLGGLGRGMGGRRPLLPPHLRHGRGHRRGDGTQPVGERGPVELGRHGEPAPFGPFTALGRRGDHGGGEVPHALLRRDELQGEPVGVLAQLVGPAPGLVAFAPEVPRGPDSGHRQQRGGAHYQFSHQVLTDRKPSVGVGRDRRTVARRRAARGVGRRTATPVARPGVVNRPKRTGAVSRDHRAPRSRRSVGR